MRILSIETSGRTFGLALCLDGAVVREIFDSSGHVHSAKIVPGVMKLLKVAGWDVKSIDKIAVSTGPGSFTGIRVGLTCAKVMAQILGVPVVGMGTLDILKKAIAEKGLEVVAAIDAGRGEVYVKDKGVKIAEARKYFLGLKARAKKIMVIGNAAITYKDIISEVLGAKAVMAPGKYYFPRAGVLGAMAAKMPGAGYEKIKPLYIRKSWAEEKGSNKN